MKLKKLLIDFVHINKIIVSSDFFALQKNFRKKLFHFFKKQVFKVLKNLFFYTKISVLQIIFYFVWEYRIGVYDPQ